jgi:hypothetical protein
LFDPEVVATFCRVVSPFPPGTEVELTDGRSAIVVSVPDDAFDRPVVRIIDGGQKGAEISLLHEPAVGIVGWTHSHARAPIPA